MLPLLGSITNNNVGNNQNFINQLAAAITTAVGAVNAVAANSGAANVVVTSNLREPTPEPPPAPRFRLNSPPKIKPNRGTAPMDIENDSEIDPTYTVSQNTTTDSLSTTTDTNASTDKMALGMHGANLFMNGFIPPTAAATNINATPYMFFPSAAAATAASTSAAAAATQAANHVFMDPTSMLAAMQHMQQSYAAGFTTALPGAESGLNGQAVAVAGMKEVVKTKNCILFPPNPNAPPPTTRERPPGCRTVFVGGLPENSTEELVREIFESCGEITTLRSSKKNFCHIRYRHEGSVDRAIYLSGYRIRISNTSEPANFGRLHVDYAQARDDLYDFECKQRQLQREQRHRERLSVDRLRSQSPPPIPHYTDHEASLVAEHLRSSETFVKAVQTIAMWLDRGDCTKRNANIFYSMIQSTHAHVRRLHADKQQLEDELRKTRENYRKQMLTMSTQFTQIEKVFSAASHKKVWDHFTKAQRKNIDQWKKLALELRFVQIEDDEMEMSDDDRNYQSSSAKRTRYDADSLKEENDSLRCQLEALRSEMSLVRTDIKYDNDYREKQIKVLQETIRNMQTQLLQMKMREQKDTKTIEQLERKLKEAAVKQLLLKTRIKETTTKLKDRESSSVNSEASEILIDEAEDEEVEEVKAGGETQNSAKPRNNTERSPDVRTVLLARRNETNVQIIDIDVYKTDDDVKIIEDQTEVVEVHEIDEDETVGKRSQPGTPHREILNDDRQEPAETNEIVVADGNDGNQGPENTKDCINNAGVEGMPGEETKIMEAKTKLVEGANIIEPKFLPFLEAKIIALVAAYLMVQPFGLSSASICNYLRQAMNMLDLQTTTLEQILATYTNLFKSDCEEKAESAAETKVQWKFCGFATSTNIETENKNIVNNHKTK